MSSQEYNLGRVEGENTTFESSVESEIREQVVQFLKSKIKNFDTEKIEHKKIFYLIYLYLSFVGNSKKNPKKEFFSGTHRLYGFKNFLADFFEKHKAEFEQPKSLADLQYELEIGHKLYLALSRLKLKNKKIPD